MAKPVAAAEPIELNPGLLAQKLDQWLDGFVVLLPNMAVALVVVILSVIAGKVAARSLGSVATRRDRGNLGEILGTFVKWAIYVWGTLIAATIIIPSLKPGDLIAGLGIGTVAIGFAFKDILQNWLAGVLILIKRPFRPGDQIEIDEFSGTIEHIDSRATMIRTFDGQKVIIPNSQLYTSPVLVKTAYRYRRSEYDVGIGYADDIGKARDVILAALHKVIEVTEDKQIEVLPWDLGASAVVLRVRWWTDTQQHNVVASRAAAIEAIKNALDAEGIDMPYDTIVNLFPQGEPNEPDKDAERDAA